MKRILGYILLSLLGLSGCQAETLPVSTQSTIDVSEATSPTSTSTSTETVPTATPTIVPTQPSESITESTEFGSTTTEIELTQAIEIYRRSYCGTCHTLTVAETIGTFGPSQDGIGLVAEQRVNDPAYTGTATNAADYLLESLVEPQAYIVAGYELSRHKMPPFSQLTDEELQAIVYLLLQQK